MKTTAFPTPATVAFTPAPQVFPYATPLVTFNSKCVSLAPKPLRIKVVNNFSTDYAINEGAYGLARYAHIY